MFFFLLMNPRPPNSTRPYTLFPYTTLVRSVVEFDTGPGTQRRSRGRKKCVGRTQDGLAGHLEEIENGGRGAGPVVEPNRWQFVPRFPGDRKSTRLNSSH